MSSAPLIGVSASLHDFGDYGGVGVHRPVLLAGGLPMTLPQLPDAIAPALDAIDALVLAPGRDIEPHRYGQQPHPLLAATEPQRDAFELELVVRALEQGLPILGMCRGLQVLNVALGGTLARTRLRSVPRQPARARDRRHGGRGQLVSPPGGRPSRRGPCGRRRVGRRRRRGDRAARTARARGAVGASGGMADRPPLPARVRMVRGRRPGGPRGVGQWLELLIRCHRE